MLLNSKGRKTHWVISIWFILLIALPFLGFVFGWDFYPSQNENRKLSAFPDLKATTLDALPNNLEAFYNDHFGFRNTFIRRQQKLERKLFKRNTSKVLKGTSPGWYFYKGGKTISDYLGNEQFTDEDLAIWTTTLETRKNYLSERGIPYVLFICPNKTMVYPEYLPDETAKGRGTTRFEQLRDHLAANSDVEFIYPLPELLKAKEDDLLYYPGDTHWNYKAGYLGYVEVITQLQRHFPEMKPIPLQDCTVTYRKTKADLASRYASKEQLMDLGIIQPPEGIEVTCSICEPFNNEAWVEKTVNKAPPKVYHNPQGRQSILFIYDSFAGHGPLNLLSAHFENAFMFWAYPDTPDFLELVDTLNPDVVVEMRVERSLRFIPGEDSEAE
jgi:alginate O-acetyltransferase complex protein AlgJ